MSVAIVFTVVVAHMSISEQYTDYYRQQMELRAEALQYNTARLFENRGITAEEDMTALLAIIFPEGETIRYEAFTAFSREMTSQLYESLTRGILIMAVGFIFFTIVTNIRKKPGPENYEEEITQRKPETKSLPKLVIQIFSLLACVAVALPLLMFQASFDGLLQTAAILFGGLLLGLALAHIIRLLLWIVAKRTGRAKSGYSSQTTQFCMFLMVFLSMFSFSMHNGFSAHLEAERLEELRLNSVFASLAAGDEFNFGGYTKSFVLSWEDISPEDNLFISAWELQSSLMGIVGEYKYGVTVIFDMEAGGVGGLSVARQPSALLAYELRSATIDFLLAMSATVFAIVFLFMEVNKLLECVNVPNMKRERELRYASGAKSLNFLVTVCQAIPAVFFVLIVFGIYEYNPVAWLPAEFAVVLPLTIVLIMMMAGGDIAGRFIRIAPRSLMLVGCAVGAVGFIAMGLADSLFLWLLLLAVAYMGVSIVYEGIQNFISDVADTSYPEFRAIKEETLSGEYMGSTSGAVLGAIVFAQFGLFAAFLLSAALLLLLAVFICCMLPYREYENKPGQRSEFSFLKFLLSKRVFMFLAFVMTPFIVGGFFIKQFAPLYADSIGLSPGATSWTFLLMTIAAAFAAPSAARLLIGRLRKITICILANLISAAGLLVFSLFPGIVTMYIASALLGIAIGAGTSMVEGGFSELEESRRYTGSVFVFKLFGALLGQLGVLIFTFSHALSPEGGYVLVVAVIIAVPTLLYFILSRNQQKLV
ncbi:MAG: MFS transporter [Defluviitaleaceae bacterium]|nr:MFS transporter [Defluviitaleaceae bacterium]